ncbi:inositol polyphosphate-5-phosphatase [Salpingoeca rosetta]|uniref:inositol-polyphosphate 5-phosphatase n=1 Tax=Salpingoeca rosetta (strain ATCC 50818 / BSB-021) TaxID=946362 RepID=F2UBM1_SALR5|nr:inositol polyphosphate-5-phosphatase [Salpingoeca rosetta]EGD73887.1 inositol polyphosphate-5-phosphatase [Salpingoeca rosetta]|eukprot:XP_004993450.1 inositol polyphosphate-5-phosphatase [Salpingoeca rosetta]
MVFGVATAVAAVAHDWLLSLRAVVSPTQPHPFIRPPASAPPPIKAGTFFAVDTSKVNGGTEDTTGSVEYSPLAANHTASAPGEASSAPTSSASHHSSPLKYLVSSATAVASNTYAQIAARHAPTTAPTDTAASPSSSSSSSSVHAAGTNGNGTHAPVTSSDSDANEADIGEVVMIQSNLHRPRRSEGQAPCTLMMVTANVGTIFEQKATGVQAIPDGGCGHLLRCPCRKPGGKKSEQGMEHVRNFLRLIRTTPYISKHFRASFAILDTDFDSSDFTALGNFYLISSRMRTKIWDFEARAYRAVLAHEYFDSESTPKTPSFRRQKFPAHFYPQWTRKGYCQTRWLIDTHEIDFVNLHLFHDASNLVSVQPGVVHFRQFDLEGDSPHPTLRELAVNFEPTYPYSEDPDVHNEFLTKRCPAWCDRVLMTEAALELMEPVDEHAYDIIGRDICMGDHKPVKLVVRF